MRELSIEEIKKIQLEIFSFFHKICEQNKLTYFMSNGTLLGAVKYSGYIPWDDDIDVCMPRRDYEKLLELWNNIVSEKFDLFAVEINEKYLFPFAKLCDKNTVLVEKNTNNGVSLGVNIDIFPLDGFGDDKDQIDTIYKKMNKLRSQLSWAKTDVSSTKCFLKRWVKRLIAFRYRIKGARKICVQITNFAKKRDFAKDKFVGNSVWGFYYPGEAHNRDVFSAKNKIRFENDDYWAPVGYDEFLKRLYGDYRKDPPIEKQVTHHSFDAYKKENI